MMNWNQNDTKYIIKRILLYLILTGIVFFAGQSCAKAQIQSYQIWSGGAQQIPIGSYYKDIDYHNQTILNDRPDGYVIFTIGIWSTGQVHYNVPIQAIEIFTLNDSFTCDIGNMYTYSDNQTMQSVYSVKCPYKSVGTKLYNIRVKRYSDTAIQEFLFSQYITFVSEESDANSIISGQQQVVQNQISNDNTNTQNIMDALAQQTSNEINAINNQTTAINNQTTVITDQTNYLKEDYEWNNDNLKVFDIDQLLQGGDTNWIRQLILFPFRLLGIFITSFNSNDCFTYSFGTLLGTELYLPCINWKAIVGNNIYTIIDLILALCIFGGILRYVIALYDFVFSIGLKGAAVVATVEVFK